MKITTAQIKKIIREEVTKALREDASNDTLDMMDAIAGALGPLRAFEELVQAMERSNAQELLGYIMQNYEIRLPGDEVEDYDPNDFQGNKMKITKQQLRKIIKEELGEYIPSKSTELDHARDAARPADPIGPQEAYEVAKVLGDLGFTLTRGGMNKFADFLIDLEASQDLRRV